MCARSSEDILGRYRRALILSKEIKRNGIAKVRRFNVQDVSKEGTPGRRGVRAMEDQMPP
jgi:hypothetical protein